MRTTYTILVAAITLMAAEQASAQSNIVALSLM